MCRKGSKVTASKKPVMRNCGYNKILLILLDYKLGDMLGNSVARKIKENNGIKIILISARDLATITMITIITTIIHTNVPSTIFHLVMPE